MKIRSFRDGDAHVIALAGELDLYSVDAVKRELRRVERTSAAVIAVDLRDVTCIDSTGVRLLVLANKRSSSASGRLVLVQGPPAVHHLFELLGLATRLPFVDERPSGAGRA